MMTQGSRSEKVRRIFKQFDVNCDGGLDRNEMAALVVAVNPPVKFTDEQISAILEEVFKVYSDYISSPSGLSLAGLLRTYDDGAGDVDRDFDVHVLALTLNQNPNPVEPNPDVPDPSTSSISEPLPIRQSNNQRDVFDDSYT